MRKPLTPLQLKLLRVIKGFIKKNNYSPSIEELAKIRNRAIGTMQEQLSILERKGYIKRDKYKWRSIIIIK